MSNNAYFWNKKTIVSYALAVLVFWIHATPSLLRYGEAVPFVQNFSFFFGQTANRLAVPLFFILAGATFYRDYTNAKYKEKLLKRVRSLVIPYLIWNTLNMLFEFFCSAFFSQLYENREKAEITVTNVLSGVFYHRYNGSFWFVFALIVLTVLAPLLDKILYSKLTAIATVTFFIVVLPESLAYTRLAVIFYLIGGLVGRFYFDAFSRKVSRSVQILSAALVVLSVVYFALLHFEVLPVIKIIDTGLLVLFSFCLWNTFDLFLPEKITAPGFTAHSFWVYATHVNLSAVITKVIYWILPKSPWLCPVNFVFTTLVTLAVIEAVCFVIKKLLPKLYGILSGAR